MSSYDMALSVVGGYVNAEEGSPEYGSFSVKELNLFDVGGALGGKYSKVQELALKPGNCADLLAEFTTMCDPEASSCSSTNEYSHQLTIQQVCDSVDNPKKLLISAIADKLDGISKMSDPFIDGRVDAEVEDWYAKHKPVVEYQHLWNGYCVEFGDAEAADNKHQMSSTVPLKTGKVYDEENLKACARECKHSAGCLSDSGHYFDVILFSLPHT
jgi:hypothetical protein